MLSFSWGILFLGGTHVTILNLGHCCSFAQGLQDSDLALQGNCFVFVDKPGPPGVLKCPHLLATEAGSPHQKGGSIEHLLRGGLKGACCPHRTAQPRNAGVASSWAWSRRTRGDAFAHSEGRSGLIGPQARSPCSWLCPWSGCLISPLPS